MDEERQASRQASGAWLCERPRSRFHRNPSEDVMCVGGWHRKTLAGCLCFGIPHIKQLVRIQSWALQCQCPSICISKNNQEINNNYNDNHDCLEFHLRSDLVRQAKQLIGHFFARPQVRQL